MADKTPIRAVFNDSNVATGLAEYQSGEFIPLSHGGIGAALSIGTAGQVLKVNSGASALEFGNVEAIVNIDGATNLESATLAAGDKILLSDGGSEGRVLLSQLDTLFSGTSKTLTNKKRQNGLDPTRPDYRIHSGLSTRFHRHPLLGLSLIHI